MFQCNFKFKSTGLCLGGWHYASLHPGLWLAAADCLFPIHPATPYFSCPADSLPTRALAAASSVVTMATVAWPWLGFCCYYRLDLNFLLQMTWATGLFPIVDDQSVVTKWRQWAFSSDYLLTQRINLFWGVLWSKQFLRKSQLYPLKTHADIISLVY